MILLIEPLLFKILPNPPDGMALFPFVLLRKAEFAHDEVLIRHEQIHLRQQAELLVLPFYVFYILHYLFNRLRFGHQKAYLTICFEKEAYFFDQQSDYLEKRKAFAFLAFIWR